MKRYEDIGNFWSERRAGNTEADVEQREAQQTLKAARRQEQEGRRGGGKKHDDMKKVENNIIRRHVDQTNHPPGPESRAQPARWSLLRTEGT